MSFPEVAGALTGLLGVLGMIYGVIVQAKGQDRSDHNEDQRLGHDDLVSALEAQRARIDDLTARLSESDAREAECRQRVAKMDRQLTDLLWNLERGKWR